MSLMIEAAAGGVGWGGAVMHVDTSNAAESGVKR
jgi:hypothetical protein